MWGVVATYPRNTARAHPGSSSYTVTPAILVLFRPQSQLKRPKVPYKGICCKSANLCLEPRDWMQGAVRCRLYHAPRLSQCGVSSILNGVFAHKSHTQAVAERIFIAHIKLKYTAIVSFVEIGAIPTIFFNRSKIISPWRPIDHHHAGLHSQQTQVRR